MDDGAAPHGSSSSASPKTLLAGGDSTAGAMSLVGPNGSSPASSSSDHGLPVSAVSAAVEEARPAGECANESGTPVPSSAEGKLGTAGAGGDRAEAALCGLLLDAPAAGVVVTIGLDVARGAGANPSNTSDCDWNATEPEDAWCGAEAAAAGAGLCAAGEAAGAAG